MSTRSILMFETDTGVAGVYVHYDGYPESRLDVYSKLIARDGVEKFRATVLAGAEFGGWSSIDGGENQTSHLGADRAEGVPGYGVRYLDADEYIIRPGDDLQDSWAEYLYHVTKDGEIRWAPISGPAYADLVWQPVLG